MVPGQAPSGNCMRHGDVEWNEPVQGKPLFHVPTEL